MRQGEFFTGEVGTPAFMAPEIHQNKPYQGDAADVWALGVLLFVMVTGRFPFMSTNFEEFHNLIASGEYHFPKNMKLSDEAKSLINSCLNFEPTKRPTVQTLLQHEWF